VMCQRTSPSKKAPFLITSRSSMSFSFALQTGATHTGGEMTGSHCSPGTAQTKCGNPGMRIGRKQTEQSAVIR
jgi:hypothetical protein